jgi:thymidylate synthase (FAD)
MPHAQNQQADALLDKEFGVLDRGFVRLVDYMGGDDAIVQAARVSYGEGTKKLQEDRGLIRYLMRHRHTTPFEMVEFKFHVKLPIFVARQWIRHRSANVNEYSGRYSVMKEEFYLPPPEEVQKQSKSNKQGRSGDLPEELRAKFLEYLQTSQRESYGKYAEFIQSGVARELARITLPLSLYTEWYWKIDLHNLFHFLKLRMDLHAQKEIRDYAVVMGEIVKAVTPLAYEAFEDYSLNALSFTGPELKIMKQQLAGVTTDPELLVNSGLSKREAGELIDKLNQIREA